MSDSAGYMQKMVDPYDGITAAPPPTVYPLWDYREEEDNSGDAGRPLIADYWLMVKWTASDPWVDMAPIRSLTYIQILLKHLRREVDRDYVG